MNGRRSALLFISGAGMELCWLYAWAVFLFFSIYQQPFSLFFAALIFGLGFMASTFHQDRGWRRIQILIFRLSVFLVGFFIVLQEHGKPYFNFSGFIGLIECFKGPKEASQWFFLALLLILTYIIWKRGSSLAFNLLNPETVYGRFDLGIAAFFVLLIMKLLLSVKAGIMITQPKVELLFTPYFIFSLLVIGLIRNRNAAEKDYIPGFQKIGVILSFTMILLLLGACVSLLFYSHLTTGAENLSGVLKKGAAPLVPVLIAVIRFLFSPKRHRMNEETGTMGSQGADIIPLGEAEKETGILGEIMKWAPAGLILLLLIAAVSFGAWYLIKYLLSKTSPAKKKPIRRLSVLTWMAILKNILRFCRKKMVHLLKGHANGVELYASLLIWGRHSGISRRQVETPLEYGHRLMRNFPGLKEEIAVIIELFSCEVYGERILNDNELKSGCNAWRKLKHPATLPVRIKTWFLSPGN